MTGTLTQAQGNPAPSGSQPDATAHLFQLATGYVISSALWVVAELGIADLLKDGPRPVDELAAQTRTDEGALYRTLRLLAMVGIFAEIESRHFILTPVGELLRSDVPNSLRDAMVWIGDPLHFQVAGDFLHSVKTGQPTVEHLTGKPAFEYFAEQPVEFERFHRAMTTMSAMAIRAVLEVYDFSSFSTIVDVASATVQRQFLLTPFPEFTNVTENYIPAGNVVYNALQVSVTKLLSHGVSAFGNFTWSHITDQNVYLNAQDPSPSRYEDPNPNLVANVGANYELPRLSGRPGYERHVLGGWQLNGILRAQNGPLVPSPGSSNGGAGTVTWLSNPRLSSPTYGEAFNTCYENAAGALVMSTPKAPACASASSVPAFQQHLAFTLNNIGPYLDVRERVHPLVDVSLFKQFQLRESTNFEIRGEFFNVFNTTTFGAPGTSPGSASFGVVSLTQVNDTRLIQLTVRVNF